MRSVAWSLLGGSLLVLAASWLPSGALAHACPGGDDKKPSVLCPGGDDKKPSIACPGGDDKKPSIACPGGDDKKPS